MKFVINLWFVLATLAFYSPQPGHDPITDKAKLFFKGERAVAKVVRCERIQFRYSNGGSKATKRYKVYDHIPVAITSKGIEALGTHEFGEAWCKKQIGNTVDVVIHPDDPTRSKISSYIQLWLLPVHILVTLLLVFLSIVKPKLWRHVPTPYIFGLFVFWIAELYF